MQPCLKKSNNRLAEREKKKGQLHKVFNNSFDAKAVITLRFLLQKITYIHNNSGSGNCPSYRFILVEILASDFVEYEHNSAWFYEMQLVSHFQPLHYPDL